MCDILCFFLHMTFLCMSAPPGNQPTHPSIHVSTNQYSKQAKNRSVDQSINPSPLLQYRTFMNTLLPPLPAPPSRQCHCLSSSRSRILCTPMKQPGTLVPPFPYGEKSVVHEASLRCGLLTEVGANRASLSRGRPVGEQSCLSRSFMSTQSTRFIPRPSPPRARAYFWDFFPYSLPAGSL